MVSFILSYKCKPLSAQYSFSEKGLLLALSLVPCLSAQHIKSFLNAFPVHTHQNLLQSFYHLFVIS